MSRLFFLLAIVAVVYLLVRSYRRSLPRQDDAVVEDMVRCAQCGVHLPRGESVMANGRFFCSAAHRDAFRE